MQQGIDSSERLLAVTTGLMAELHPEAAKDRTLTLDSSLERDLGLDSLARMELLSRLEKVFGLQLPEEVLIEATTLRDISHHLNHVPQRPVTSIKPTNTAADSIEKRDHVDINSAHCLTEILDRQVNLHPDSEHIRLLLAEDEKSVSFLTLQQKAHAVANRLLELHLKPGEPVAIMLPTCQDYFYSFFGILYGGGIPVPLYPPARPSQIEEHVRRHRKIIENAGAAILITVAEVAPVARILMSQVPELEKIITIDNLYSSDRRSSFFRPKNTDTAFLQYTSGSTGDPKGVVLSHANLLANIRAMGKVCSVTANDVFVSWLPLYHDMGLIGAWLGSLCHGCRLVIMPPLSFLARPKRWLAAIDRFDGTLSASPNFGYELCCNSLDESDLRGLDLSSWRFAFNGAEPIIAETLERFQKRFTPYGLNPTTLSPVYGLAESSVGLCFPATGESFHIEDINRDRFSASTQAELAATGDPSPLRVVNCGRPLPGHQVRVVDEQNRELPERRQGKLQFKGPSTTSGYYRNPEQTKKLFAGDWLESGDLAYIAAGDIYLTAREKDLIIRGGRNIYPHEVEEVIGNIQGIRKGSTAVFGCREEKSGTERLVVLTESRKQKTEAIRDLKNSITRVVSDLLDMPPDDIVITPPGTVLKTSSGKIRRNACKQLYENNLIGKKKASVRLQLARMALASVGPLIRRFFNRLRSILYAGYCWLLFFISGTLLWVLLMALPTGIGWRVTSGAVRLLCRLSGIKVNVSGEEHIPVGTKYLLASNHQSYLDSIILTGMLPEQVSFVTKVELAKVPLMGAALRKLQVFFVDRLDAAQGIADTMAIGEGLRHGRRPLFFVEGTLQRTPGLLPFQLGAFILASRENIPIVPIVVRGTRNVLRGDSWFPRRDQIEVTILPPLSATGSDWHGAIELRDMVRKVMIEHLNEPDLSAEYTSLSEMGISKEI